MIQAIDRIQVSADHAKRYPDSLAEGLWVILDPEQTQGVDLPLVGQIVTIERPDGSTLQLPLDGAKAPHGVLGLHFRHLDKEAIPRLSLVSW
jgi:hypothetical protein